MKSVSALAALVLGGALGCLAACGGSGGRAANVATTTGTSGNGSTAASTPAPRAGAAAGGAAGATAGDTFKIAFLGDSVTAGLGLLTDEAYPGQIARQFADNGYNEVEVINAGVSGDTTAGGVRRLNDVLEPGVRIVVVALGGNDALRGLSPTQTHDNLATIIRNAQAKGVQVVLVGMLAPPNLGPDYRDAFSRAFTDLAKANKSSVTFVPFLLEGVAGDPTLNQADGIHPTAEGARVIADHLYPILRNLVDAMQ